MSETHLFRCAWVELDKISDVTLLSFATFGSGRLIAKECGAERSISDSSTLEKKSDLSIDQKNLRDLIEGQFN